MLLIRLSLLFLAAVAALSPLAQAALSVQEKRGKRVYLTGVGAGGKEIVAYLGNPPMDVPGSLMACANCHGLDGRGKPEGGVAPSDITWQNLTKSYGVAHEDGRKHPPYTVPLVERALLAGVDPAGHKLNPAMPVYKLSREDLSDLVAYLVRVGDDRDPGITPETITVGTLVPVKGPLAGLGETLRSVLTAYFAELNTQGGIYSRKIDLRVVECGQTAVETKENLARFIDKEEVFALAGAFIAGADRELASLLEQKEVPLVGPSALSPHTGFPLNRQVFYLFPGIRDEARALAVFATQNLSAAKLSVVVLHPEQSAERDAAEAVESECRRSGWDPILRIPYARNRFDARSLVQELSRRETNVVFFLGTGQEEVALVEEAVRSNWKPVLLAPGSLGGSDILRTPPAFQGRIYISFPMRSSDQIPAAAAEYRAFAARNKIGGEQLAVALSAYSSAHILVEALKKAGRELSREKLISALEGMYKFQTGLTPPVTYGANRRIGAQGAYIAELEFAKKNLVPVGGWIEVQ